MLDISIPNLEKNLNPEKFLKENWYAYEKYDGTKLTILRTNIDYDKNDFENNWLIAYKGNVMYPNEFQNIDNDIIRKESIGISQYKLVFDHLRRLHKYLHLIPKGTEFFCEFLMQKPTLTRKYKKLHSVILLDFDYVKYSINSNNQLITESRDYDNEYNSMFYSNQLGFQLPRILLQGSLYPTRNLFNNCIDFTLFNDLESYLPNLLEAQLTNDFEKYYQYVKELFLNHQSEYGGVMEGVVFWSERDFKKGIAKKLLQPDQHDKEVRRKIKSKFKEDSYEKETEYYQNIFKESIKLIHEHHLPKFGIQVDLAKISSIIFGENDYLKNITHSKKSVHQIRDDFYLTTKLYYIKHCIPENNNALFIGRFEPPTKTHVKIVEEIAKTKNRVIIGIVDKNKEVPFKIVQEMWKEIFPEIEIIKAQTGNILRFIQKTDSNINWIVAGTDRIEGYKKQLKNSLGVNVIHYKRTNNVSATNVRNSLKNKDKNQFKENMDSRHYKFYDKLLKLNLT